MDILNNASEKKYSPLYFAILGSCICALAQLYGLPHDKLAWVSLSVKVLQFIWLVMGAWVLVARIGVRFPKDLSSFLLLIIFSVIAFVMAVLRGMTGLVDIGIKMLGFLTFPIMLFCSAVDRTEDVRKIVVVFHVAVSLIFIDLYHSDLSHIYEGEYAVVNLDEVTLGYSNPNLAALFLLVNVIGLVTGVFYCRSRIVKFFLTADAAYIARIMLETESRTTALLLAVFLILVCCAYQWRVTVRWVKTALVIPLAALLLTVAVPGISQLTFMGEPLLTGREEIYIRYFSILNPVLIAIGDMNVFRFDNLHNGYLAIAASIGVPACISYIQMIGNHLKSNLLDRSAPMYTRVAFVGFLCLILQTSVEAAFFVGGSILGFLVFTPVVFFSRPYAGKNFRADES